MSGLHQCCNHVKSSRELNIIRKKNIIVEYRREHIRIQERERAQYDRISTKCTTERDPTNSNPLFFQIFPDGMTTSTGDTPHFFVNGRIGKNDHGKPTIESRVIGMRVICGPFNELFVYYTDNLVRSGANTMCEICRRAMQDLAIQLKTKWNYRLPRHGYFQFDNCGENKVRMKYCF